MNTNQLPFDITKNILSQTSDLNSTQNTSRREKGKRFEDVFKQASEKRIDSPRAKETRPDKAHRTESKKPDSSDKINREKQSNSSRVENQEISAEETSLNTATETPIEENEISGFEGQPVGGIILPLLGIVETTLASLDMKNLPEGITNNPFKSYITNSDGTLLNGEKDSSMSFQNEKGSHLHEILSALKSGNSNISKEMNLANFGQGSKAEGEILAAKDLNTSAIPQPNASSMEKTPSLNLSKQMEKTPSLNLSKQLDITKQEKGMEQQIQQEIKVFSGETKSISISSDNHSEALKNAIPSTELAKETKTANAEKNSLMADQKTSLLSKQKEPVESQGFKNAGENSFNNKNFELRDLNRSMDMDAMSEKGTGKIEFQLQQENSSIQVKGTPQVGNTLGSISTSNEARMMESVQTGKSTTLTDMKPQEVFERSVVDQIVSKATLTSRNGMSEMRIQLDPPSLGTIKIQISVSGDKVSTTVLADNSIARDIVERNIHQLRNSFSEQGLKVDQISVGVGSDPRQQAEDHTRPFFMGRGFTPADSSANEEIGNENYAPVSKVEPNYGNNGSINLFV